MKRKNIVILLTIVIIILFISGYYISKKIQEENRKYEIEQISDYKYFPVKENDKYGVIDITGNKIIDTKYENIKIPNPEKAVFICYQNEKTTILNDKGEEIFKQYENVEPLRLKNISSDLMYEKNTLRYSKNGKYGIIDLAGKKLTGAIYDEIDTLQFKEGELIVKKDGKYGVINLKGATLVKTNYDSIDVDKFYEEDNSYKNDGYIVSKTTEEGYRYGYVDVKGKEIIPTKYNDLYRILEITNNDIYIIYAENGQYGLSKNGKNIIQNDYQSIVYNESCNVLIASKGKKYGVLSMEGKAIVPFLYKQIDVSGENIYATTTEGQVKVFNNEGKEVDIDENTAILNVENTDYEIYIQTKDNFTGYSIYKNNKQITQNKYIYIEYLYNNYFIACNENGKIGIIDDKENIKIQFNYNSIQRIENTDMIQALNNDTNITQIYSKEMKKICELKDATLENNDNYIKIYNNSETKYVTKDEKEVNNTEIFTQNTIFAKKYGNKWGFVNKDGNKVVNYIYDKVTEINKYGFAGIKENGKWGVINNKGEVIISPIYELEDDNPIFIGEYYQIIYGNGEIYYTK